jgi:hypothetical protein
MGWLVCTSVPKLPIFRHSFRPSATNNGDQPPNHNRHPGVATTSSTTIHNSVHSTTTFYHTHNFHNAPHNNNQQSANKQNFLSITWGNLECLIEHTTNAEESLYLEGEGGRSKSKSLRTDGSSFLNHWSQR